MAIDTEVTRGFSTDQRIYIENLNVKSHMQTIQREQRIVDFSIEESTLARQTDGTERTAQARCPIYDNNIEDVQLQ